MAANYYKKTKKYCKRKPVKVIKIFLKKKKTKNVSILVIDTESFFSENVLSEKKKMKNVNMHAIYIIIFLKKKPKKGVNIYVCEKMETFPKKKTTMLQYAQERYKNLPQNL